MDVVDLLLERVIKGGKWPPESERKPWTYCLTYRAFGESDREALKKVADWNHDDREYKVDPLPERIREAWADHLFGEELEVTPAADGDDEELDALIGPEAPNDLTDDARAAEADFVVPEGEGWYRIYTDLEVADVPLLEWHSRASVIPYYIGKVLKAVALVSILEGHGRGAAKNAIFRHLEIHSAGAVEHVLFRGTKDRIGSTVPLDAHPETEELARTLGDGREQGARWDHGLSLMLMGRVINKRGRNPRLGKSEYEGIKDYLLDLNEAVTIGAENARLTAKRRIVLPPNSSLLQTRQSTDNFVDNGEGQLVPGPAPARAAMGEDVIIADPLDGELGRDSQPFKVLEYSFDAEALIAHKRDLVESALTRVGLTPQWVGVRVDGDGFAASGTALRLRLIPTDKAGRGKARPWDRELPRILAAMQQIDALPVGSGGFGRGWVDPTGTPGVKRANPLPTDEVEEATVEATLVGARVRSRFTSIKAQHPEWSDDDVDAELERIDKDTPAGPPLLP